MTRILKLAAIFLSVISLASAQIVDTLNTPLGPVTQGAKVPVTWSLLPGSETTTATGDLSALDAATNGIIPINSAVPLAAKSFLWEVKVPPGTYTLGLNDGSGTKQSGKVDVKAAAGGAPAPGPPAAPGGGSPPPPGPPPAAAVSGGTGADTPAASTPTSAGTSPSTPNTGSASSIFSGYEIVFSLLGVGIAMVQF